MPSTPSLEDSWSARVGSVSSVLVAFVSGSYIRSRPWTGAPGRRSRSSRPCRRARCRGRSRRAGRRRAPCAEVRPHRAAAVGVLARGARDPADAADEVLDQVVVAAVLEVGGGEVPEARGPDAARPRTSGTRRSGGRRPSGDAVADVVGLLVERHQHVVGAAHVGGERVVLVAEAVAVGQVLGRRVVAVGDLDGRDVVGVGRRVARHQRADRAVARRVPPRPRDLRRRPSSPRRASPRGRRRRGRTPRSPPARRR